KKHPLGEKRNHPGSKLRQGFWMVFRLGVNNWGLMPFTILDILTLRSLPTESVGVFNGCFLYSFSCNS
ncbi:hypothetical protein, partial [Streptococcus pneumoniae]